MKRAQDDDVIIITDSGGRSPCALRHHNEAPTKKKARRTSPEENDATAAPRNAHGAARPLVLSDLPDLVLHQLVRELAVGDAIRLRATSSFWADLVVRDHPLARFVLVDLLPRFASLPPPLHHYHDEEDRKNESESESSTINEEEDEEDLEAELAWILADAAEAAGLAEQDTEKKNQPWGRLGNPLFCPGIGGHDGYQGLGVGGRRLQLSSEETTVSRSVDERWELRQAVRIAADARLHELRLRSCDFWRDVASSDVRLQLSETEAFSLAQRVHVRATINHKSSSSDASMTITFLRIELPQRASSSAEEKEAMIDFVIKYNHHQNCCYMAVSGTIDKSGSLDQTFMNIMSGSLGCETEPQFNSQAWLYLVAKLDVNWTPWQLASFVMRCADGVLPALIDQVLATSTLIQGDFLDHGARSCAEEKWLYLTSRIHSFSSPNHLTLLVDVAKRWQYRLQLAEMWHQSAELDWPSSAQLARLASCVRSGQGAVTQWSPVESSLRVEAACSFRLAIVDCLGFDIPPPPSCVVCVRLAAEVGLDDGTASTGGAEETLEIEVECEFSVTYAHRRLVLVARGGNDPAMKWLGTRSPTDKQTIFQSCVPDTQLALFQVIGEESSSPRGLVVKQHAALLELIGRALDLHHEPNEDSRFYGVAHKSDIDTGEATTSQGQDDEEETASVVEPMQRGRMWDSKRVAYFLALCCLAPANVYAFNPTFTENCLVWHEEERDLSWHLNAGRSRDDPRQRLLDQLDLWADPDQEWREIAFVFV